MWYVLNLTPPSYNYDGREIEDVEYVDLTDVNDEDYQEVYCG